MKKFILFILIVLISSIGAFAYDSFESIEIGDKSLPKSGNFTFSFKLLENQTLYFNLSNKSQYLNLNFPSEKTLIGTDSYNFTVNWSITETVFPEDITLLGEIIVKNSFNLNNHSIGMEFKIKKEGDRVLIINGSDELIYQNGMYIKTTTIDKLPNNGSLEFFISGNPGEEFKLVDCGNFLICNNQTFKLNENGGYNLELGFFIPLATAIGIYNETFNISSNVRNSTINIQFDIGVPNILLMPFELGDECFQPNAPLIVQIECENKFRTHQVEVIRALQNYLSNVNTEKICEQLVRTEYVVGDSISEIVMRNYLDVQNDNTLLREDNTYLSSQLNTCQEEKLDLNFQINETLNLKNQEIIELRDIESQKRVELFKASEIEKQEQKANMLLIMKIFCFVVFILSFSLIGLKYFFENSLLIDLPVNVYIVGSIGLFFFFSWLGLFVWG